MSREFVVVSRQNGLLLLVIAALGTACAAAPKPTAASREIRKNPPALVEGRVLDATGRPVAGIAVRGIPWSKDVPWSPPATTGCDGRFRLSLPAPASYGFLLLWRGISVITPSPDDPSRITIRLSPGQSRDGVELAFLGPEWKEAVPAAPAQTAACP